jgi:hypothetical protein
VDRPAAPTNGAGPAVDRVKAMGRTGAGPVAATAATGRGNTRPEGPATPVVVTATGRAKDVRPHLAAIQEPLGVAPRARVARAPGWARDQGPARARQEDPALGPAWAAAREHPGPAHFHAVALMPPTGPRPAPRPTAEGRAEVAYRRAVVAGPAPVAPAAAQVVAAVGDVPAVTGAREAGSEAEKN